MHLLLLPVVSAIIASFDPAIISKFAKDAPPLIFNAVRALIAMLPLSLLIIANGGVLPATAVWIPLLAIASGVIGPGIGGSAYIRAIQVMGGSLSVVISHTYIFVAQLLSAALVGEALSYREVIGGLLAFSGILVAVLNREIKFDKKGVALASTTAIAWGSATVLIKLVDKYVDIYTLALLRLVGVLLFALPVGILHGERIKVNSDFIIASAYGGIVSWGIGMFLYVYAVHVIGVSATVVITAITPVLSQICSKLIAAEELSARVVVGALLVALGILMQVR